MPATIDEVKTHAQDTAGPDAATRALTKQLADLAKRDGPRFAAVVRQADAAVAAGAGRDEALRAALERSSSAAPGRLDEHPADRLAGSQHRSGEGMSRSRATNGA